MTNSSSLSKLWLMLWAAALAVLVGGGLGLLPGWPGRIGPPLLAAAAVGALGGAALWLRRTEQALQTIADTCAAAAGGNLEARLLRAPPPGLLGQTQRSVNAMLDVTDAFVREATGSMQYFSRGLFFRRVLERGLPGSFGRAAKALNAAMAANEAKQKEFVTFAHQNVEATADKVSAAAAKLHGMAEDMSATSGTLAAEAGAATTASEAGLANVQTIAAAAEQLSVSVAEISRQVAHSAAMAQDAVQATEAARATVGNLAEAAQKVGEVLRLINAIASRTNLLALNATIEAARAGEFGKGFEVVASEVKSLARQTEHSTSEIDAQVTAIRTTTERAVQAIAGIGAAIGQVGSTAAAIAAAVEQQGAATQEIARSIQQAADGTRAIAGNVATVTAASGAAGATARQVLGASSELATDAERLHGEVTVFLKRLGNS